MLFFFAGYVEIYLTQIFVTLLPSIVSIYAVYDTACMKQRNTLPKNTSRKLKTFLEIRKPMMHLIPSRKVY